MTTTDELRSLLDELGIEWIETAPDETRWFSTVLNGNVSARRVNDKLVIFTGYKLITPEQAIAATLGYGECKLPETRIDHGSIEYSGVTEWRRCSACGTDVLAYPVHFCPNCGRRVMGDE